MIYTLDVIRRIEKKPGTYSLPAEVVDLIASISDQLGISPISAPARKESLNGLLNKLTHETYPGIAPLIGKLLTPGAFDELYAVMSGNMFYAKLYAQLCSSLVAQHPTLQDYLQAKLDSADLRRLKDTERSHTALFAALGKAGLLPPVKDVAPRLCELIVELWDDPEQKDQISELTEHLFILITTDVRAYRHLRGSVAHIAAASPARFKGLCNKTTFRLMDISDRFEAEP
jgi:hypothetical protein